MGSNDTQAVGIVTATEVPPSVASNPAAALFQPGPIHIQPTGESLFGGGFVGGLHLGPAGDRLPGSDPLENVAPDAKQQQIAANELPIVGE